MYKKTVQLMSEVIAQKKFEKHCEMMDKKFSDAFNKAFEGERISTERMQRIGDKFINILWGEIDG